MGFGGSGSGGGSIAGSTDVALNNPADTQVLTYDVSTSKWKNAQAQAGSQVVTSVATRVGDVVLSKADVQLGNVDNTSDASKPISTATQASLDAKVTNAGGASGLWKGTQAAYTSLGTYDTNTVYIIVG